MRVLLRIRMQMMMAVFRSPPQHAFLGCALREECKYELKRPACRVGSMGKIPMIPAGYRKHAQPIQNDANCDRLPADARPDHCDATCVDGRKRDEIRIHDIVLIWIDIGRQDHNLGCFQRGLPPRVNSRSVVIAGSSRTYGTSVT